MNITPPRLGRIERLSILAVAPLGYMTFLTLPYEVASLTGRFEVREATAGWIASAELLTLAVLAVIAGRSIETRDKRLLTMVGVVLAIIGAAGAIVFDTLLLYVAAHLAIGAGLGVVTATTNALPAMFSEPEKTYAQMVTTMSLMFAGLMYAVPAAIVETGPKGFEVVELLTLVILGALAFGLPHAKLAPHFSGNSAEVQRTPKGVVRVLVAIFSLYASQAVSWTFAESAGHVVHLSSDEITTTFTVLGLAQIPAAIFAGVLGMRVGYRLPLTIGWILLIVACLGIYNIPTRWTFIPCAISLTAVGAFTIPYLQALVAELDVTGRSAAIGGAFVNLGAAAGPAIGSAFYSAGGLPFVGLAAAGFVAIGLGMTLAALKLRRLSLSAAIA